MVMIIIVMIMKDDVNDNVDDCVVLMIIYNSKIFDVDNTC